MLCLSFLPYCPCPSGILVIRIKGTACVSSKEFYTSVVGDKGAMETLHWGAAPWPRLCQVGAVIESRVLSPSADTVGTGASSHPCGSSSEQAWEGKSKSALHPSGFVSTEDQRIKRQVKTEAGA